MAEKFTGLDICETQETCINLLKKEVSKVNEILKENSVVSLKSLEALIESATQLKNFYKFNFKAE